MLQKFLEVLHTFQIRAGITSNLFFLENFIESDLGDFSSLVFLFLQLQIDLNETVFCVPGKRYNLADVSAALCMSLGLIWFTLADSKVAPNFNVTGTKSHM